MSLDADSAILYGQQQAGPDGLFDHGLRGAGMAGATTAVKIDIGDICTLVTSAQREIITHVRRRYRDFVTDRPSDITFEMSFAEYVDPASFLDVPREMLLSDWIGSGPRTRRHAERPDTPQGGGTYTWWAERSEGESRSTESLGGDPLSRSRPQVSHLGDRILFQRSDFAGCLDVRARRGRTVFREGAELFAVESFLRIGYSFLAVERSGLLLHSAGVLRGDRGYIFPGPSGTGKSTIASLVTDRERVLSDEMVVVRKRGEGSYWVYSTPFYGTNESAEASIGVALQAALLPVKDREVGLRKARPALALSRLLSSVLFFGQDPALTRQLMDISADLVACIPFYLMHFRRDDSFWGCIDELERNGGD